MDKKQAFAIIILAEAGLNISLDYSHQYFFQGEKRSMNNFKYHREETEAFWKERFHCKTLKNAYIKRYGYNISKGILSDALEMLLSAEDTTTVIREASRVLMKELKVEFSVIENPNMKIVLS